MKTIKTDRLILSEPKLEEAQFYYDLLNSPAWIKNIGDRGIKNNEDAKSHIRKTLSHNKNQVNYGAWTVYLKETNVPIGFCGLFKREEFQYPNIGFAVLPAYERNGYTYEASLATLKFAKELNFPQILGITVEENLPSQRLLKKLGLTFQKVIQYGDYDDMTWLYSIHMK